MRSSLLLAVIFAISISPLVCQSKSSVPRQVRHGRSILSSFFDGLKTFHKLVHEKEALLKKEKEKNPEVAVDDEETDVVITPSVSSPACRTEFVVVESVHYALESTEECVSQNVTNCKKEPYQHCQDVLREVCRDSLGEECRDKLHEECQTRFKEEMSNTKVRECNEECLQEPNWRAETCECRDVTRLTKSKVPYLDCRLIKRKQCRSVPVRECKEVTEEQCTTLENTVCEVTPEVQCRNIQRKVPHTLQRRKPVEVCQGQEDGLSPQVIEA